MPETTHKIDTRVPAPVRPDTRQLLSLSDHRALDREALRTSNDLTLRLSATLGMTYRERLRMIVLGGPGSGNFGHSGRPGEVGGSSGEGGGASESKGESKGSSGRSSKEHVAEVHARSSVGEKGVVSGRSGPSRVTPEQKTAAQATVQATIKAKSELQPLTPPTADDASVKNAAAIAATETKDNKVPVESLLDALGGNSRAQFAELLAKGAEAQPDMVTMTEEMKEIMGDDALVKVGKVKGLERAVKKVVGKDKGDARNVRDVVRSSLAVDHVDNIENAVAAMHAAVVASGGEVIESDDKFVNPMKTGYRDFSVNVRMPNGAIGEIQVHLASMLKAKDEDGGHELYEEQRTIAERGHHRDLTPEETARIAELNAQMQELYGSAWKAGGGT